ncbi:PREDICTED: cytochrome P450 78A4-like [Populus euphratica]|uniref:Cytochrome P450 78A4-like n=1 Tax=Populus euphratica TaxID=75702 RepID=A0AAJ6T0U9_POPEU|nr:PREDICTED: cytochrome P450 78A4-like [Populus euphratica]
MMSLLANLSFVLLFLAIIAHQTPWPITVLLLSLFSSFALSLNYWLVPGGFAWRNHHDNQNPSKFRGPIGWPVLGTLPQMGSLAHRKLASMANSLGATKLMAFSLGTTRVIISSHPDTAREILCASSFADRPVKESARLLMFERAIGFAPSGDYWRHLRRIAANHMFSPRKISGLEPLRQRLANEMLAEVSGEMKERRGVVLRGILQKGSLSNVLESVLGSDVHVKREELGFMAQEGFDLVSRFNLEDYFPLRFLDFHGVKRRCYKLAGKVNSVVGQFVRERKRAGDFRSRSDFLSALLSLPEQERLDESDMVPLLWEMIFRGTDTVAILLEWIMARMVLHPEIQAKAHQELEKFIGNHRQVQDSDIPNLPYLQAIVKEVLRLHPPGPLLSWARIAIHDVHVDKMSIPAGTTAMVNMWAITHDPSIWKDPWAFNPDRFMEEDVLIMGSDLRLAPFGSGRRVCPGKALGLATVHLWLARLLHEYKWLPAKPVDLSECLRLSLEMKRPLECHVVPWGQFADFDQKT